MARGGPSKAEIRAVQKALASRQRQLQDHLNSLDVLLNLNNPNMPPDAGPPGPDTSAFGLVVERYGRVAQEVRKTRDAVGAVNFDADDKRKLKAALSAAAKSWEARARMAESMDPAVVEAELQVAQQQDALAANFGKSLHPYFEKI